MFHVVLHQPEIPPNTGNISRLCANTGASLHLIEPLGFSLSDKAVARAGLDYHHMVAVSTHASWAAFRQVEPGGRVFALTTRGTRCYADAAFRPGDVLLFGSETRGLPDWLRDELAAEHRLRVPMKHHSRSMNLSNSVAVVLYEAWRQCGFGDGV